MLIVLHHSQPVLRILPHYMSCATSFCIVPLYMHNSFSHLSALHAQPVLRIVPHYMRCETSFSHSFAFYVQQVCALLHILCAISFAHCSALYAPPVLRIVPHYMRDKFCSSFCIICVTSLVHRSASYA